MPARPKPRSVRPVKFQTYVPEDVAAKVDLILHDPVRCRVKHGARSRLVEMLLRRWLRGLDAMKPVPIDPSESETL